MSNPVTLPLELTQKIIGMVVGPLPTYELDTDGPQMRKVLLAPLRLVDGA